MPTNKFFIEIRDDTTAIITSVNKTGLRKLKQSVLKCCRMF